MIKRLVSGAACAIAMAGCAPSTDQFSLNSPGTDFYNPYRTLAFENGPVGPNACFGDQADLKTALTDDVDVGVSILIGNGSECAGSTLLFYPGAGNFAFDRKGNRVRLSKADRRRFSEQFERVREQVAINNRLAETDTRRPDITEHLPEVPPVETRSRSDAQRDLSFPEPARGDGSLPR